MKEKPRRRLSSAHVMAAAALFIALGGTAFGLAQNSVGTKQLKNNAVKSSKIKDGAVKTGDLADSAVTGAKILDGTVLTGDLGDGSVTTPKIADNAVTGAKADESTFDKVPSATDADHATTADSATHSDSSDTAGDADTVNSVRVVGFRYRSSANTPVDLFSFGGLTVTASCNAGALTLTADTSQDDSQIHSFGVLTSGPTLNNGVSDSNWDAADAVKNLVPTSDNDEVIHLEYAHPAPSLVIGPAAVSAIFQADTTSVPPAGTCVVTGHAFRSGSGIALIG